MDKRELDGQQEQNQARKLRTIPAQTPMSEPGL